MEVVWTDAAKRQLRQILRDISDALSPEDASRWYWKIKETAILLETFPFHRPAASAIHASRLR